MNPFPFHLAFPVHDLEKARHFYGDILGCPIGRTSDAWIDFDFFGNQITAHLGHGQGPGISNQVERLKVPVPHFGAILPWERFHELASHLQRHAVRFVHQPQIRFAGEVGEQATMFIHDGNDNILEFKSFKDMSRIFASA